jgi:hypothetical protein
VKFTIRQPTSVFTDAAGAFEFDLKKSEALILFFQRRLPIVEQNITTGSTPNDCAEENHKPI